MDIDKLKAAKDYYESKGYKYIEVPWTCPKEIQPFTIPNPAINPSRLDNDLFLVGSAEQSFLQMIFEEKMPNGFHQTITPCFRSDKEDDLHQRYFMKLELISYFSNSWCDYSLNLMGDALLFFNKYVEAEIVKTDIGYDIRDKKFGIELGSYGNRDVCGHYYCYGTGLALPRLNYVISH